MVVTFLPASCETGVEQERIGFPSTCRVQAPHSPAPQPNFVPVSCRVSRTTQSNGVSGGTETVFSLPLTRKVMSAMVIQLWEFGTAVHGTQVNGKGEGKRSSAPEFGTSGSGLLVIAVQISYFNCASLCVAS